MWLIAVVVAVAAGCAADAEPAATLVDAAPRPASAVVVVPAAAPARETLTFAVLSDLHLPNSKRARVEQTVAALVAARVRFVVITGDFTNGAAVDARGGQRGQWWGAVTAVLAPLRAAGIPVLPIAGNHDTYLAWQRSGYAATFGDLTRWAAPLAVHSTGAGFGAAPYSYSVDVEGVHLSLVHVVQQDLERDVATWLRGDLAAARDARLRLVFGHVPLASVIRAPAKRFGAKLGAVLAEGHASAYIAGHEHVVWDEDVALPGGGVVRQVLVGCSSGFYDYEPSPAAKARAGCTRTWSCAMPNGGGAFGLVRGRKGRLLQHHTQSYALVTVRPDDSLEVVPMTIDDAGRAVPFYR